MDNEEFEIQMNNKLTESSKNSIWQELKDAIRGSEADYTEIKIGKAIFSLAVPIKSGETFEEYFVRILEIIHKMRW